MEAERQSREPKIQHESLRAKARARRPRASKLGTEWHSKPIVSVLNRGVSQRASKNIVAIIPEKLIELTRAQGDVAQEFWVNSSLNWCLMCVVLLLHYICCFSCCYISSSK